VDRFNGVIADRAIKVPCAVATSADIALSGNQLIDGVNVVTNDRVLVRAQTNAVENGIYDVKDAAWARAADWDGNRDVGQGTLVGAYDSSSNFTLYELSTPDPITIGSTAVTLVVFVQGAGGTSVEAGTITNAMLRWDGVDTYRQADRIRATINGANFQIYDAGQTEFMDLSYVGTAVIFTTNNASHTFEFQRDVVVANASVIISVGNLDLGDNDEIRFGDAQDVVMVWNTATLDFVPAVDTGTNLRLRDGMVFAIYSDDNLEFGSFSVFDPNFNWQGSSIDWFQMSNFDGLRLGLVSQSDQPMLSMLESSAALPDDAGYGQFWVRDDTDQTPMFTDEAGVDYELNASGGGSLDTFNYQYDDAIALADPGAGFVAFNSLTISLITAMAINIVDADGNDLDPDIDRLVRGSTITMRDPADPTRFAVFSINGNKTDLNPYWIIGINPLYTGTLFTDQSEISVRLDLDLIINMAKAGSVTGAIPIWDQVEGQLIMPDGAFRFTFDAQTSGQSILHSNNNFQLRSSFRLEMDQPLFLGEQLTDDTSTATMGQIWVRENTSPDPQSLMFTDDDNTEFVIGGFGLAPTFVLDQYDYQFSTSVAGSDPGAGFFRFNNAIPASITQFNVSDIDSFGLDLSDDIWAEVIIGSTIRLADADDLTIYFEFTVVAIFNGSGFWIFNVDPKRGDTLPANNANITVQVTQAPYFDMATIVPADGSVMTYRTTTDDFQATANRGTILQPSVGLTAFRTSDSILELFSSSRIRTNVQLHVAEASTNDALILSGLAGEYQIGTGSTSAKHLDLSAHVGALSVRIVDGSTLMLEETANALADILTYGQVWVRTDAALMYTDEAGNDFIIGGSLDPLPVGTDEQTLVNVSGVWTASDFFKHDDSDIITLENNFGQVFTVDLSNSGLWRFGGAGLNSMDFGDTVLNVGSVGTGAVFEINYAATIMSLATNTAAHTLRLGNTGTPWTAVELMQGTPLRFLEAGGVEPMDMNNDGNYVLMDFNSNTRGLKLDNSASIYLEERAAANTDETNYGQFWVRDDQTPMFTTEVGVDSELNAAAGGSPFATPLVITGDINTATPPTSEAITSLLQFTDLAGDDVIGSIGFNAANDLQFKCFMRGSIIDMSVVDSSGNTESAFRYQSNSETWLFYNGNLRLATESISIRVNGTVRMLEQVSAPGDTTLYGQIWVRSDATQTLMFTDESGVDIEVAGGDRGSVDSGSVDGEILNWNIANNAWEVALELRTGASRINVISVGNADPTVPDNVTTRIFWQSADFNDYASLGFNAGISLQLINTAHGGDIQLRAENAAGSLRDLFIADPDGAFTLYHDGVPSIISIAAGLQVRDTTGDNPTFQLYEDDGVTRGFFITALGASGVVIASDKPGNTITIQADDTGGSARNILIGDPDAETILNADTNLRLQRNVGENFITALAGGAATIFATLNEPGIVITPNAAVDLYYNDAIAFRTNATGAEVVSATDNNPQLDFYQDDGSTLNADILASSTGGISMSGRVHGAFFTLQSEDSGGTPRVFLQCDPDAITILRGDTDVDIQVGAGETAIYATGQAGVGIYYNDVENLRTVLQTDNDMVSGAEVLGPDSVFRGVGFNSVPKFNVTSSFNHQQTHIGKMYFYDTATARTITFVNDGSIIVGEMMHYYSGPTGGTLTFTAGSGVTLRYWNGTGWTTTATAGSITVGDGQGTIYKDTDTRFIIDGPNLS
jgi:hypothetical protein